GADEQCDDNAVRSTAAVDCRNAQICALRRVPVACPLELLVECVERVSRSNEQHGVVPLARCRVKDADVRRRSDELTRGREYQYVAGTAEPHEIPVAITAGDSEDVSQLASQLNCAPQTDVSLGAAQDAVPPSGTKHDIEVLPEPTINTPSRPSRFTRMMVFTTLIVGCSAKTSR